MEHASICGAVSAAQPTVGMDLGHWVVKFRKVHIVFCLQHFYLSHVVVSTTSSAGREGK